jgi:hypothetical protein
MKKFALKFTVLTLVSLFLIACEKDDDISIEESMKTFMQFNSLNQTGKAGEANNFMTAISASQFNSRNLNLSGYNAEGGYYVGDSLITDSIDYWEYFTCATVTETVNPDGTTTTVYDYGEGCDEYGSVMKGKITYVWKNVENSYESKVIYENFYSYGTTMNGYSENTFTSDGNSFFRYDTATKELNDSVSYPEIEFNWSGESTSKENLTITTDDGNVYSYVSEYSTKWDNTSYTVLKGSYHYKSKIEDYEYIYLVSKPLITNYECNNTWVPVSGTETTSVLEKGNKKVMVIDYGRGKCDNYATVTINGKSKKVDMSEWYAIAYGDTAVSSTNRSKVARKIKPAAR